jgi:hypothetical protein
LLNYSKKRGANYAPLFYYYYKKIFIFIFYFIYSFSFSQNIIISDLFTKQPIPFVNILIYKENKILNGFYCNEKGVVNFENSIDYEKIEFSCIGYETKSIVNFSKIKDTVFLIQKSIVLNEVKIIKRNNILTELGFCNLKKKLNLSSHKGSEIVVFIYNNFKKAKEINSILFKIRRHEKYKTAVRIHLYKKAYDRIYPGAEIFTEDIIQFLDGKLKGLVEVNVSKYRLELPFDGVFVGIEWLGIVDKNTGEFVEITENSSDTSVELNDEINQPLTFMRNNLKNINWSDTERLKNNFVKIKYKNYPNASFGIKIYND